MFLFAKSGNPGSMPGAGEGREAARTARPHSPSRERRESDSVGRLSQSLYVKVDEPGGSVGASSSCALNPRVIRQDSVGDRSC